ncbi:MAG: hypothetical protein ABI729_06330 [Chitinophagales bacterium]
MKINYSLYCCLLLLAGVTIFFNACSKGPGEGGTSTIKGKIYIKDYNGAGQLQAEYYAPEERVYLIFGDDDFYGLDTRTSFDGTYEFQYLKKGSYTVFAYSDCDTCASSVTPISIQVEISENHATVELEDIMLRK